MPGGYPGGGPYSRRMEVRAVAFDIGGVMVRIAASWDEAARAAGLEPRPGLGPLGALPEFAEYQAGEIGDDEYLAALGAYLGEGRAEAEQAHRAILLDPMPGTEELVADLEALGIVCGCLSNTNALHWGPLVGDGTYPALARMQVQVASHRVRSSKPEQAVYRAFERDAGASGAEVAYFDDVAEYVEGGRAMGWRAWQVPEGADPAAFMREALASAGVPL